MRSTAMERAFPGVTRIRDERMRQKVEEGYTDLHDDMHDQAELADAAGCYTAMAAIIVQNPGQPDTHATECPPSTVWPFDASYWKPSADPVRNLERAGALIAAEIERLIRLRGSGSTDPVRTDPCAETRDLLGDMTLPVRLLKVQEETGEAADAYIGWTGANPRKGVTNDRAKLEEELLDVALTALVAWCDVSHDQEPLVALERHAEARNARHRREVPSDV